MIDLNRSIIALIEIIGYAWLLFIVQCTGAFFLAAPAAALWELKKGRRLPLSAIMLVFLVPLGAFIIAVPVLSLFDELGIPGAILCQGAVLAAGGALVFLALHSPSPQQNFVTPRPEASATLSRSKRAAAAIPAAVLTAACGFAALAGESFLFSQRWAAEVMAVEFLVIHSGAFLGLMLVPQPQTFAGKGLKAFFFVSVICFYLSRIIDHHWYEGLAYLSAALGTYGGYVWRVSQPHALVQLFKRWAASLVLFMLLAAAFRMNTSINTWHSDSSVFPLGALYFALLAVCEAFGLYDLALLPAVKRAAGRLF